MRILSTEGRGVRLSEAHSTLKVPNGLGSFLRKGEGFAHVGLFQTLSNSFKSKIHCDPKGSRIFLRFLSIEGRSARLCWTHLKHTGPAGKHPNSSISEALRISPATRGSHTLELLAARHLSQARTTELMGSIASKRSV